MLRKVRVVVVVVLGVGVGLAGVFGAFCSRPTGASKFEAGLEGVFVSRRESLRGDEARHLAGFLHSLARNLCPALQLTGDWRLLRRLSPPQCGWTKPGEFALQTDLRRLSSPLGSKLSVSQQRQQALVNSHEARPVKE